MTDEASFLKAIADQPAERSTRLVFADWLDEHDRPHEAEFLRLQLQVAELNARLLELGGQRDAKWLTAVGNVRVEPQWITLRFGRLIVMRELRQQNFYEGQLEGNPSSSRNHDRLHDELLIEERHRGGEPYLIQPEEVVLPPRPDWPDDEPRGWFPTIACVGRFDSLQPAKDPARAASTLTIIWFQHEFAFPIDPGVREQIRAIEWEKHAHDFDW